MGIDADVYVRERGVSRFNAEVQTLFRVVGIADLCLWKKKKDLYFELPPSTVKKLITGDGRAAKETVAEALASYIGEQTYQTDDESDACAVGIAWFIANGMLEPNHLDTAELLNLD